MSERAADVRAEQCRVKPERFSVSPGHEAPAGLSEFTAFTLDSEKVLTCFNFCLFV